MIQQKPKQKTDNPANHSSRAEWSHFPSYLLLFILATATLLTPHPAQAENIPTTPQENQEQHTELLNSLTNLLPEPKSEQTQEDDTSLKKGITLVLSGRVEDAVAAFKQSLKSNPHSKAANSMLGLILYKLERDNEARPYLEKALTLDPQNADICFMLGVVAKEEQRLRVAIHYFKKTIEIEPSYAKAHFNLGTTYGMLRKFPQAIDSLTRASELTPDASYIYSNLGLMFLAQKNYDSAEHAFKKALKLEPENQQTLEQLAEVLLQNNKLPEAAAYLKKALHLSPEKPQQYLQLGSVLLMAGDNTGAITTFRNGIKHFKDNTDLYALLGLALTTISLEEKTPQAFQKAEAALKAAKQMGSTMPAIDSALQTLQDTNTAIQNIKYEH